MSHSNRVQLYDTSETPTVKPPIPSSLGQKPKSKAARRKERERRIRFWSKENKKVVLSFKMSWGALRKIKILAACEGCSVQWYCLRGIMDANEVILNNLVMNPFARPDFKPPQIRRYRKLSRLFAENRIGCLFPLYHIGLKRGMSPN